MKISFHEMENGCSNIERDFRVERGRVGPFRQGLGSGIGSILILVLGPVAV